MSICSTYCRVVRDYYNRLKIALLIIGYNITTKFDRSLSIIWRSPVKALLSRRFYKPSQHELCPSTLSFSARRIYWPHRVRPRAQNLVKYNLAAVPFLSMCTKVKGLN